MFSLVIQGYILKFQPKEETMSNPNGTPPVPSKELNPLQGLSISKVDHYGLGGVIKRLVNAGNKVPAIHKELHEKHLPPDAPRISIMAIHRWIKKNIGDDYVDGRVAEDLGKRHDHVLGLLKKLSKRKIRS